MRAGGAGSGESRGRAERERWNARHGSALAGEPAPWVTAHRSLLAGRLPGRALDVGCGLGRHALLLAELGFEVEALDISDVAVERLSAEARRRRLPIAARRADLAAGAPLPPGRYDVIIDTFFLERSLFGALARALAPGGLLVAEAFGPEERRIDARHRLAAGELREAFPALEVVAYREGRFDGRHVASIVARSPGRRPRIVVACVGNVLRRDDGFGPSVAARLGDLPDGVEVLETGIGGVALLQELMGGCDGLIVVDAVDRGAAPGTVFVLEPDVRDAVHIPDVHLANPDRVLSMAKALGRLPARVVIVGCQAADADGLGEGLSPPVQHAVGPAIARIREIVADWLTALAEVDSTAR